MYNADGDPATVADIVLELKADTKFAGAFKEKVGAYNFETGAGSIALAMKQHKQQNP